MHIQIKILLYPEAVDCHLGATQPHTLSQLRAQVDRLVHFVLFRMSGSSAVVQICNALLQDVLPPATQDPSLNYICVKRITDALGVQQVNTRFSAVSIYTQ